MIAFIVPRVRLRHRRYPGAKEPEWDFAKISHQCGESTFIRLNTFRGLNFLMGFERLHWEITTCHW
jgi:hypothetical protein